MTTSYSLLLFAFDGTLADTAPAVAAAMGRVFERRSGGTREPSPELVRATLSLSLEQGLRHVGAQVGVDYDPDMIEEYREAYNEDGLAVKHTTLFAGAEDALGAAQQSGARTAIVSNRSEAAVHAAIDRFELGALIDCAVGEHPEYAPKPDPAPYHRVLDQLGLDAAPEQTLVVGDTGTDMTFGSVIGSRLCWARYGYGPMNLDRSHEPHFIIDSLYGLPPLLAK